MLLTSKKPPGSHVKPVVDEHTIWRICVDYKEINKRTKKNDHPLPNAMNQIQKMAGHKFYCFLDLKDGFWHIIINPKNREKTAFVTPFGIYE
jgi:putative transposase